MFKKLSNGLDRRDIPPLSSIVAEEMIAMADILPNFFHAIVRDDPTAAEIVGLKIVEMLEISVTQNYGLLTVPQTLTGSCVCVYVCVLRQSRNDIHNSLSHSFSLPLSVTDSIRINTTACTFSLLPQCIYIHCHLNLHCMMLCV